jgi:hypothetical protein
MFLTHLAAPRRVPTGLACAVLAALAASALAQGTATRLLVLDQDAGPASATRAGSLFNVDPTAPTSDPPGVEAAADSGAPFALVSGLEISPFDGEAYVTDLGYGADIGAVHAVSGLTGAVRSVVSANPALDDPFDLAFVRTGAPGRRLVVVDWDADPSGLGPDSAGGPGHGALYWVDETTGALSLLSDGTVHDLPDPSIESAFDDPVGVAWDAVTGLLYVADLTANPLGLFGAGAVFSVNPASGAVSLAGTSDGDFLALTAITVRPDGTPLVLDAVQSDSIVWSIDTAASDLSANHAIVTGGIQYALIEGLAVDAADQLWLVDSGEWDPTTMTFVVPPAVWRVDGSDPNTATNGRVVNDSLDLVTPVSIDDVGAFRVDRVTPSDVPPLPGGCAGGGATVDLVVEGEGLFPGMIWDLSASVAVNATSFADAAATGAVIGLNVTPAPALVGPVDLRTEHPFNGFMTLASAVTFNGTTPGAPPCSTRGDASCDDIVDGIDLAILGMHFGERRCVDATFVDDADFNDDDAIDGGDLSILATFFGTRP